MSELFALLLRRRTGYTACMSETLTEEDILRLVTQVQQGDPAAFERLYDHYFVQVYRYCAFRAPAEVAEDVTADIFVKVWENIHRFSPRKGIPFGAWLFRIARHAVIDAYRAGRTWDDLDETLEDPDGWNRADAAVHRQDIVRSVRAAFARLPRRYRDVLVLSYVAGLPHDEVARVLRLSLGGVRILKHRALRKLEQLLPPETGSLP